LQCVSNFSCKTNILKNNSQVTGTGLHTINFQVFGVNYHLTFLLWKSKTPTVEMKSVKGEVGWGHVGLKLAKTGKFSFFAFANFFSEVDRI